MKPYFPTTHDKPTRSQAPRRLAFRLRLAGALAACCFSYALAPSAIGAEDSPANARGNGGNMIQVNSPAGDCITSTGTSGSMAENTSPDAAPCERTPSAPAEPASPANMLTVQPLPLPDRHWSIAAEFNAAQTRQQVDVPLQQVPGVALR